MRVEDLQVSMLTCGVRSEGMSKQFPIASEGGTSHGTSRLCGSVLSGSSEA